MVKSALVDLYPDEIHYYQFNINLDMCDRICNTIEDSFGRICVLNKIEDVNLKVERSK